MGFFSKDIKSLQDLFMHGLQDIYYAENQIVKSLPTMIENAHDAELKRGLQQHLRETEKQIKRLEQVFALNDWEPQGTKCPAIDGILQEGDDLMGEIEGDDVLNVGIVAAAQAVEHYEITRYGALIAWARELGRNASVPLFNQNLAEERAADRKLTALAERRVNPKSQGRKSAGRKSAARKSASLSTARGRNGVAKRRISAAARKSSSKGRAVAASRKKTTRTAAAHKKTPKKRSAARR